MSRHSMRSCRWLNRSRSGWVAGGLTVLLSLAGCARPDLEALDARLKTLEERPQGHVNALPEQPSYLPTHYTHADRRSPFVPWAAAQTLNGEQGNGPKPDPTRRKDPLEAYPLDALRFAGTLFSDGRAVALVQTPDGNIQRLYVGQHLGQHSGRVVTISNNRLVVIELMPNEQGGWQEERHELTLGDADAP